MYGVGGAEWVSTMTNVPRSVNVTRGRGATPPEPELVYPFRITFSLFKDTYLYVNYGFLYSHNLIAFLRQR